MGELSIMTLCQALSNFTSNRCIFIDNPNICRCNHDCIQANSIGTAPEIMLSEVFLIFFVLGIWLSAIGFCLNQYKSLRRLETQVHYFVSRKDPLNIGDIKIVTREQDSIIYKKKRYSTLLDTNINSQDLKAMHYVQQYLPKGMSSTISPLLINRDEFSTTPRLDSPNNIPLNTHDEILEYQSSTPYFRMDMDSIEHKRKIPYNRRGENARVSTGLTVPHVSQSSSSYSSWNEGPTYETCSTQHLGIPSNSLGSNCYSSGNISLPVPYVTSKSSGEKLLDPRMISDTVRRSLLALHRESQENVNMLKKKDQTRSENDVHGALTGLKKKMKSKSKCAQQQYRPHSNTLSIAYQRTNSNEHDRHMFETQSSAGSSLTTRRSLKDYPKEFMDSTTESETNRGDSPLINSFGSTTDDDESVRTIFEN